ncbi:MAG: NAD-dependent DNA ligase LigA [Bacteroidales bacterium]|jgi:DNA ligase (NAD+)|nr:NAD-dependent DNA ligase LigA [Bacteroidota bacterium]MDY0401546.1 NAD-dependent DNA ligase LigA [Bacteroidales bacterium]HHW60011.1 NAD-dependent DNA ligase LigA [Bacteroidales bacterium]
MTKEEAIDRIKYLTAELNRHNYLYYVKNSPEISDYEYDQLLKELEWLEKQYNYQEPDSPTQRVGGFITKEFPNQPHRFPMLSLDNSYDWNEVVSFFKRNITNVDDVEFVAELKYDGLAISCIYENGILITALTRGDGTIGEVVTNNVKTIKNVPLRLFGDYPNWVDIRGEIIMPFDSFNKLNKEREENSEYPFANPRNAAAGSLKLQDSSLVAKRNLQFMPYEVLTETPIFSNHYEAMMKAKEWGAPVPPYIKLCHGLNEVKIFIDEYEIKRDELPFGIDGVVIKINNYELQRQLGNTAKYPRWAVAFKYKPEQALTQITSVDFQVGRTGVITPVANLNPVLLSGTTVKRVTLHNFDFVKQNDIHVKDYVWVEKSGEIIPKIVKVEVDKSPPDAYPVCPPRFCPACNSPTLHKEGDPFVYCTNDKFCPPQILGKLQHFISKDAMDIETLGEEKIELLYRKGLVKSPADLYNLTYDQLLGLENQYQMPDGKIRIVRFQHKTVENILKSIEKSKSKPFDRMLYALGIKNVGSVMAKNIANYAKSLDKLMQMSKEELQQIPEVGDITAQSIIDWFSDPDNLLLIERLKKAGLKFALDEETPKSEKLKGLNFVISGVFEDIERDDLKRLIEANGGKVLSSVSSNTDYLIAGDNMGPAKRQKANELGIPIISFKEFVEKFKINNI